MKQEALAAACKVSRQTVSNWERNKTLPDIASLKAIATAFDTSVDAPHIIERFDADSRRFLAIFFLMQVCWVSSSLLRLFAANAPNHEEELSIAVAEAFVLGIWIMSFIPYLRYTRRNGLKTIGDISAHLLEHLQQEKSLGMRLTRSILSHIDVWNCLLCDAMMLIALAGAGWLTPLSAIVAIAASSSIAVIGRHADRWFNR